MRLAAVPFPHPKMRRMCLPRIKIRVYMTSFGISESETEPFQRRPHHDSLAVSERHGAPPPLWSHRTLNPEGNRRENAKFPALEIIDAL